MRSFLLAIALAALAVVPAIPQTRLAIGSEAPMFSATSLSGERYELAKLRGSVVVLTFWSTRCPICHEELPKLDRVIERFKGSNVVFLSMTMERPDQIESYLRRSKIRPASQLVPDSFGVVLQYADRQANGNLDMAFPSYFVIDQSGRIQARSSGFDKTPSLAAAVTRLTSR